MFGILYTIQPSGEQSVDFLATHADIDLLQQRVGGLVEVIPYFDTVKIEQVPQAPDDAYLSLLKRASEKPVRCVAFCNEEGKLKGIGYNELATRLWAMSMVNLGVVRPNDDGDVMLDDVLVGPVVIAFGDDEFLESL
jgi:hypothetical protein